MSYNYTRLIRDNQQLTLDLASQLYPDSILEIPLNNRQSIKQGFDYKVKSAMGNGIAIINSSIRYCCSSKYSEAIIDQTTAEALLENLAYYPAIYA